MIEITNLKKSFGHPPTEVLRGITANIFAGEMVSIVGRSGSGKSTLLYILSTLDRPTSGSVRIDGVEMSQLSVKEIHEFRNLQMGYVFQFHHLLPELNCLENVLMPAVKRGIRPEDRERADFLLAEFGLLEKAKKRSTHLSGGEQQRVAIARALLLNPKYLFADEPTGNLDSRNGEIVLRYFQKIHKEYGTTIIFVTHDAEFAKLADREILLKDGLLSATEPAKNPHSLLQYRNEADFGVQAHPT
jgi:ABC-type lipoprotein export system ATPase subunit